jgi:hypothetical protein
MMLRRGQNSRIGRANQTPRLAIRPVLIYIEDVTTRSLARTGLRFLLLLAFAAITLSINFLHTEKGPLGGKDCPACHFLTSSLSTGPGVVLALPALLYQGVLASVEPLRPIETVVRSLCSRSPPQA